MISRQRRLSYVVIHLFMFLSGVEYAVIFPTLWEFLQSLGVLPSQTYWLGLCLSSMTVTDMLTGLAVGKLLDVGQFSVKRLVVILNCCQIAGACLYLLSCSQYMILASRLVSGLGKSITIVFLTDICRSTQLSERTPVLLVFNIAFQLGLLLGPGFNLVLSQLDLVTALGRLNKLNSPGLLLALAWSLFSVLVVLLYSDLVELVQRSRIQGEMETGYSQIETERQVVLNGAQPDERSALLYTDVKTGAQPGERSSLLYTDVDTSYPSSLAANSSVSLPSQDLSSYQGGSAGVKLSEVPSTSDYGTVRVKRRLTRSDSTISRQSNIFISQAERLMRDSDTSSEDTQERDRDSLDLEDVQLLPVDPVVVNSQSSVRGYFSVLLSQEMICLTYLRFVALFCQTCLESSVPPIMEKYFSYGDQANSVLYLLAGLELILVFGVLNISSRRVSDRALISTGLVLMLVALTWLSATLPRFAGSDRSNLPYFAVGVVLDLAGIPTVCDIGLSLYSKLLPDNMQGVGHGVRRFVSQLAIIIGPIWGAGTLAWSPYMMLLVPLGLLSLGSLLFVFSYRKLNPATETEEEITPAVS